MVLAYNTNAGGGLLSGAEKLSSAYLERNRRKGLASGLEQIQGGDWEGGVNTIAQTDPDTALGLAQYKQEADDKIALQQAKMQQEAELRNTLTPYQQEMLALKRQQLAQGGESNPFNSKNEFINLMGIRNNPQVWDSLPDDQKALVNARLNYMSNNPDNAYDISYQKKRGSAQADIETRGDIAYQGQLGKDRATLEKENTALERNLPAFEDMTNELIGLADKATYTKAGQARDWLLRQTGQPMSEGGIAREKYRQVVANELIPKLKQMFGGQLSDAERESLLATLGDVNLAPEEKKSAINAFIEAKRRQVKYNQPQTGQADYKSKYGLE
jgi:hypothetical protein